MRPYYLLTKPGIIRGNAITTTAGLFLGAQGHPKAGLFLITLIGSSLVVASGCVFNNYLDRGIDEKMARTKKRALVTGSISNRNALIFGTVLGIVGFLLLAMFTNMLTVLIGIAGWIFYVVVYGYFKRNSVHGTIVGSISGAVPPVAGYTAVTGQLDGGAILLFLILVAWQMPHFYAIAIYRLEDYTAAGIPVLPAKRGTKETKRQILLYIVAFTAAMAGLTVFGYTGSIFLVVALLLGGFWLKLGLRGDSTIDDATWGRKMFGFSLLVINLTCLMIIVSSLLPGNTV